MLAVQQCASYDKDEKDRLSNTRVISQEDFKTSKSGKFANGFVSCLRKAGHFS